VVGGGDAIAFWYYFKGQIDTGKLGCEVMVR